MRLLPTAGICLALGLAGAASAGDFGFESLLQLIAERHVDTPETLLAALPADLRTHYTLVFASRSLQDATMEDPRVLLFGTKANLILSFNGNSSQRGFDAIETMEFVPDLNRFVFREISFRSGDSQSPIKISEPNPARCTACHDSPARPIWDVPPVWPGVYGERYRAGLSSDEMHGMRRFLSSQATHPRYRYLLNVDALADRDTYVPNSRASYTGAVIEPPNARLSSLLTGFRLRSILSELARQPGFESHLPVLVAAAGSSCGALSDFYPPSMQAAIAADYKNFSDTTLAADRRQMLGKALRRTGADGPRERLAAPSEFTSLRYVVERGLNVSTQHWTLAFERGSYDFSAPAGTLNLEQSLFEWLARGDPDVRSAAAYRTFNADDPYCAHLKRRSVVALAAWYGAHPVAVRAPLEDAVIASTPPLLARCAACHSSDIAPPLPFSDVAALRARLVEGHFARGRLLDEILYRLTPQAGAERMPRGMNIDAAEQHELEDYFVRLARSP